MCLRAHKKGFQNPPIFLEEREAQRGEVTSPRSHSWEAESGLELPFPEFSPLLLAPALGGLLAGEAVGRV